MKISCNILKKHIKNSDDIDWLKVWDKFTIRTAEVEGIEIKGKNIDGLVIGQITKCEKHPESRKLHILTVDIGKEQLTVLCGAPNVALNQKVAFIKVGGHIGDITITKKEIAGIESCGMCCAEDELGISDDHQGIMILPDSWEIGKDLKYYIPEMDDIIVEIDNKSLTNRPDLWGHYGIAREIAAITKHELIPLELTKVNNNKQDLSISIKDSQKCYRYSGIKIGNIENNQTPLWMKIFLYYAGMRSISLIVDLTNYLMLELGQPMHAFDARVVKNIEVGCAKDNDTFKTLDGVERKLTKDNLMIKNGNEYFGIAGVMGGLDSEILSDTKDLVLESANFEASNIRKTATALGLRTEASARYEKSLDPNLTITAIERFINLLQKENPNLEILSNLTDIYPNPLKPIKIKLYKQTINKYMDNPISDETIEEILKSLQFKLVAKKEYYEVEVPTFRATKDVSIEADLIEEIARMYGYENFVTEPLKLDLTFKEHENIYDNEYEVKRYLATKYNLNEVHSYIWYKSSLLKELNINKENVKLIAKSEDNILRDDLALSLLEMAKNNFKYQNSINIFEIGTEIKNNEDCRSLSIILGNEESQVELMYNKAKEIVYSLLKDLKNHEVTFTKSESYEYYISDYSLDINVSNTSIGQINIVHPKVVNQLSKKKAIVTINIDFKKYLAIPTNVIEYQEISKYPEVQLDYTIITGKENKYSELFTIINEFKSIIIKNYQLIDIYEDNYEKKYNIRYTIGANDRTLSQEDLADFKEKFIKHIKKNGFEIIE